ncbi:penicillin-binding protein 1B [Pseudomaricurvus sp. HS19]|uniref:penicillin-binding protein 1B n=1 Tax=Pseudomaricurvus sp. HS19 TaxID=2692626 RepID=UPI00136A4E56|nr:penicillin-binding protein 1B [Pseudomaricurvus sp. HS19]MYM63274.1 penicillin-binding protein 1B [Pseudomaricurvus sp. HS19]
MTRKRTSSRGRKRSSRTPSRFWRWLAIMLLLPTVVVALWLLWLDFEVRDKFDGRKWALPARVYAQPLELYQGRVVSVEDLRFELQVLGYREVGQVYSPGQWSLRGSEFDIYVRPFAYNQRQHPERRLRLQIANDRVASLQVVKGTSASVMLLEPAIVGGIYPTRQEDRELIRLQDIPPLLGEALIAVEDRSFVQHWGVSPVAIARAAWVNVRSGRVVQGGSTLTQQLVKNFFLDDRRTFSRKLTEASMSLLLELHYSKAEILETYMNEVYLGQSGPRQIHGFGLAARHYFGRPLTQLKTEQLALLVGMVKGASYYNPWRNPQRALERRNLVLTVLQKQQLLTAAEADRARRAPLGVIAEERRKLQEYPAFIDLVRRQLLSDYSEEALSSEGLKVFTTLSLSAQRRAEAALSRQLQRLERGYKIPDQQMQGAVVVTGVGTGEVLALVGDRQTKFSGFNRALDATRPIGSLAKPAVYLTALQHGYNLASLISDGPVKVAGPGGSLWEPRNFDHQSHGEVLLIDALTRSYNQATARLGMTVGLDKVERTLRNLGVTAEFDVVPAMLLGAIELSPLQVSAMYHSIANDGVVMPLRAIRAVETATGEPLSRYAIELDQSVDENSVALLQYALQAVVREGTGRGLYQVLPPELSLAGKTGTTDNQRDSWFAGFSGQHLAVVWLGRDDNGATPLTGSSGALTVWREMFRDWPTRGLDIYADDKVEYLWVDQTSGLLSGENCRGARLIPFDGNNRPLQSAACDYVENPVLHWMKKWF